MSHPSDDDVEHSFLGDPDVFVVDPFNEFVFLKQQKVFALDDDLHKVSAHEFFGLFFDSREVELFGKQPDGDAGKGGDVVLEKRNAVLFQLGKQKVVGNLINAAQIGGGNDDFARVKKREHFVDGGGAERRGERHSRFGILREARVFEESLEVVRSGGQDAFVSVEHRVALDHDRHVAQMLVLTHGVETGQGARRVVFIFDLFFAVFWESGKGRRG